MLQNYLGLRKSKTSRIIRFSAPHVKSSVKLDSFLNFSKINSDSMNSINTDNNNNIVINVETIPKVKNKHSSLTKHKNESLEKEKKYNNHPHCFENLDKSLKKKKLALSEYILTNTFKEDNLYNPNIKLLGNSRYKYTSPLMFVEDHKNNIPNINLGLVPIPMEKYKIETPKTEENEKEKKLYELQRSIVMLRRKQYNISTDQRKLRNQFIKYNSNSLKNTMEDISEYINKIVLIQKWWNNLSKKNDIKNKINIFQTKLRNYVNGIIFKELKKYLINYKKPFNLLCYISKKRCRYLYHELLKERIKINKNENSLNSVELDENEMSSNKKERNLLDKYHNYIYNINSDRNEKLNISRNDNNRGLLKYKINRNDFAIENLENINNYYNKDNQNNENNDSDDNQENNSFKIKYLKMKENNLSSHKKIKKKIYQNYDSDKISLFSDYIKKIFFLKFKNKLKLNENLPGINIYKTTICFISKIRRKKLKKIYFDKNMKIERMQQQINYMNNKIYIKPMNSNANNLFMNSCYISKTTLDIKTVLDKNNKISFIEYKQDNKYIQINKNDFAKGYFLTKIILKQMNNKIKDIQKIFKEKHKERENKNNDIIYKITYKQPCYSDITRKNNYEKLINTIQQEYRTYSDYNKSIEVPNKKPLNNIYYYISKKRLKLVVSEEKFNQHKNNLNYLILLVKIIISKNVQELIFQILKSKKFENKTKINYYFPFYLRTLQRITNYIKKNENPNKAISLFFNEIFNFQNLKTISILKSICFLSEKNHDKLINSNIFASYKENDLINFLSDFSEFDKNLNNEEFIIERLKKIKLNNTNIFSLVKLIDNEYNKLVKGLYCFKCYNEIEICNCNKDKNLIESKISISNDMDKSNDRFEENLNFDDFSDDSDKRRQINFFDYNKDDKLDNNILIKTKTKNNDENNKKLLDIILPQNYKKNKYK